MEVITKLENTEKVDLVLKNFHESQSFLQSSRYISEWTDWDNLYRNVSRAKPEKWMSNLSVPLIFSKIQAAHSNLMALFFASNPNFDVKPRESGDETQSQLTRRLLQYQFDESRFYFEFSQFLKSLCIFGTGIGKIYWDRQFDSRTEWTPQFEPVINILGHDIGKKFIGTIPQEKTVLAFDGPRFINCNINDIFPDPTAIEIQDSWVIHRTYRSLDYLRQMNAQFPDVYNSEVMKLTDEDGTKTNEARKDLGNAVNRLIAPAVTRVKGTASIELLERWGLDIDPADGKIKPRVLTLAAGKYLIRNTNNPNWSGKNPFVKGCYIPVNNDFYGIGVAEILEQMQYGISDMVNQRMDNISLALNRIILFKRGSGLNKQKLKSAPGHTIGVDEEIENSVKYLDMPLYTQDTFAHTAEIERWAQEATSITKMTLGLGGKDATGTASGMAMLQANSGNMFTTIGKMLEYSSFVEIIKMFYQLDYQYVTDEQIISVLGEKDAYEWVKIPPDAIRKSYDFVAAGIFSIENKQQKALRLIQFKNITKDDPTIKQHVLNRKIYQALEVGDNPSEIMIDDAEQQMIIRLAGMMAEKMMEQAMIQKAQGAGEGESKVPGINSPSTAFQGNEQVNTPGVPPPVASVAPRDRV